MGMLTLCFLVTRGQVNLLDDPEQMQAKTDAYMKELQNLASEIDSGLQNEPSKLMCIEVCFHNNSLWHRHCILLPLLVLLFSRAILSSSWSFRCLPSCRKNLFSPINAKFGGKAHFHHISIWFFGFHFALLFLFSKICQFSSFFFFFGGGAFSFY